MMCGPAFVVDIEDCTPWPEVEAKVLEQRISGLTTRVQVERELLLQIQVRSNLV